MDEKQDGAAPAESNDVDGVTLQELLLREARKRDPSAEPAPKLPPFLGNLTPKQLKEKSEGFVRPVLAMVGAWVCYSAVGAVASLAISRFLLRQQTDLIGADLWRAQLLLAAPYLVLAFAGGILVKTKLPSSRGKTACLVLATAFALSRLSRFQWCGPADAAAVAFARFADAAMVFLAAFLGFGMGKPRRRSDAEHFGPEPIEP